MVLILHSENNESNSYMEQSFLQLKNLFGEIWK